MLSMSLLVAVLDGIGLTMFLPLLQSVDSESEAAGNQLGDMAAIVRGIEWLGLPMTLTGVLLIMLFFFVMKGVAKFGMEFYRVILQQRFANAMRLKNITLLAGYNYREFAKADSGRIQNTLSGEVNRVNKAYSNYFQMLQFLIMTGVYVGMAYIANPKFAAIVAIGGLVSNLAFNKIYRETKAASRRITEETNIFQGFLIESVSSFKFLKATNLIAKYTEKISRTIQKVEAYQRRIGLMNGIAGSIREPLVIGVVVIAILIQVQVFEESLGLIILSLLFFYRGLTALSSMQTFYNQFLGVAGSIENMDDFTRELQGYQESPGHIQFKGLKDQISVSNLTYGYDNTSILKNLSFTINRFETIGIVGESGSGKTTLVNLICSLLPVEKGHILVDGIDISDLDKASYRNAIGYVTQESQVFSDTIYNNVSFWDDEERRQLEKVNESLRLAHADNFIRQLPDGTETRIGINGVNLSGGQRQRLSIAREMYRNVDLLILDEATSALDSQSERLIQENIESLAGSLTMLVIAHRLSTIRKADKIIYLKPGGDYEIDTFDNLLNHSESFRRMVNLQEL